MKGISLFFSFFFLFFPMCLTLAHTPPSPPASSRLLPPPPTTFRHLLPPPATSCRLPPADTPAVREEKGACFRLVGLGKQCLHPVSVQLSKQLCCCSVGKAWGPRCDKCPSPGTGKARAKKKKTIKHLHPSGVERQSRASERGTAGSARALHLSSTCPPPLLHHPPLPAWVSLFCRLVASHCDHRPAPPCSSNQILTPFYNEAVRRDKQNRCRE